MLSDARFTFLVSKIFGELTIKAELSSSDVVFTVSESPIVVRYKLGTFLTSPDRMLFEEFNPFFPKVDFEDFQTMCRLVESMENAYTLNVASLL